jgi:hypothetical protein
VEDLSSGDIAESHVQMKNDLDLGNSTEESQDSCDNKFPDPEQDEQRIPFHLFYDTALELRHLAKDGPEFDSVWPPLSVEINFSSVERLYNQDCTTSLLGCWECHTTPKYHHKLCYSIQKE